MNHATNAYSDGQMSYDEWFKNLGNPNGPYSKDATFYPIDRVSWIFAFGQQDC